MKITNKYKVNNEKPVLPLSALKEQKITQLWESYNSFQEKYFNQVDVNLITSGFIKFELPACQNLIQWIFGLWRQYYSVKDQIQNQNSASELEEIDLIPDVQPPEYTVRQISDQLSQRILQ